MRMVRKGNRREIDENSKCTNFVPTYLFGSMRVECNWFPRLLQEDKMALAPWLCMSFDSRGDCYASGVHFFPSSSSWSFRKSCHSFSFHNVGNNQAFWFAEINPVHPNSRRCNHFVLFVIGPVILEKIM